MARTATGIDIGTRTAKVLRGRVEKGSFAVTGFALASHRGADAGAAWQALELGFKPARARIGLTGRDVNIRYTRVPRVPDWQLKKLMRFEVEEIGDQSGSDVASDFNVLPELPEIEGEDVVLLCMAREGLLSEHLVGLAGVGGTFDAFTPNAIALYNAWLSYGVVMEDTVLVANIGHENLDVILVRGTDLLFARNMTGGSRQFDEAIAARFGVSEKKAEDIKLELVDVTPGAAYESQNHEKASRAALAPAGQLLSLLQSTVLFCKSQMKISGLKVDRVLLCGGGAALRGLERYLASGLSVQVELFDPFRVVDTEALDEESAALLEDYRLEAVVALGLATTASDPAAYSIEILPGAVRARREFVGGTAFLIAAGVLALAFLGWFARERGGERAALQAEVARLERDCRAKEQVDRKTRQLLDDNRRVAELAGALFQLGGQGEQLARVLAALERTLPSDFWLEEMTALEGVDPELGVAQADPRPLVRIRGKAREGTQAVVAVFEGFVERLRAALPSGVALKQQLSNVTSTFALDLTLFAPRPDANGANDAAGEAPGQAMGG